VIQECHSTKHKIDHEGRWKKDEGIEACRRVGRATSLNSLKLFHSNAINVVFTLHYLLNAYMPNTLSMYVKLNNNRFD